MHVGTAVGVRRLENLSDLWVPCEGPRLLLGAVCLAGMQCLVGTLHYKGLYTRCKCMIGASTWTAVSCIIYDNTEIAMQIWCGRRYSEFCGASHGNEKCRSSARYSVYTLSNKQNCNSSRRRLAYCFQDLFKAIPTGQHALHSSIAALQCPVFSFLRMLQHIDQDQQQGFHSLGVCFG